MLQLVAVLRHILAKSVRIEFEVSGLHRRATILIHTPRRCTPHSSSWPVSIYPVRLYVSRRLLKPIKMNFAPLERRQGSRTFLRTKKRLVVRIARLFISPISNVKQPNNPMTPYSFACILFLKSTKLFNNGLSELLPALSCMTGKRAQSDRRR